MDKLSRNGNIPGPNRLDQESVHNAHLRLNGHWAYWKTSDLKKSLSVIVYNRDVVYLGWPIASTYFERKRQITEGAISLCSSDYCYKKLWSKFEEINRWSISAEFLPSDSYVLCLWDALCTRPTWSISGKSLLSHCCGFSEQLSLLEQYSISELSLLQTADLFMSSPVTKPMEHVWIVFSLRRLSYPELAPETRPMEHVWIVFSLRRLSNPELAPETRPMGHFWIVSSIRRLELFRVTPCN